MPDTTQLMSLEQAQKWACFRLTDAKSDSPQLDAEVLLQHSIGQTRTYLFTWPERLLTAEQQAQFQALIAEREQGKPVAHLIGEREFWSLPLSVNPSTLIPRPDTEVLVEQALAFELPSSAKVLDLGTGTGAIALALASEQAQWQITAVDKMPEAVKLASHNRDKLGLTQVTILQSDWFSALDEQLDRNQTVRGFDLIVSNPPYIDETDPHLSQGDVRFEPLTALTAPEEGFADLYWIAEQAKTRLNRGGWLLLEHGYQQAAQLRAFLEKAGYQAVASRVDYGGNERCTFAQWFGD